MENENEVTMEFVEEKKPGFFKRVGKGVAAGAKWVWRNKFGIAAGAAAGILVGLGLGHGDKTEANLLEDGEFYILDECAETAEIEASEDAPADE